jgi:phosphoribosylaminoimidazole carboxylase (NCAIR synthetase)
VLRRVNRRSFYVELGGGAPGACFLTDPDQLARVLCDRAGAPWLFKRAFGFAGRGQRRILGEPSADDQRWLADSLRLGGMVAEPWLQLERDVCLHGWLAANGQLTLGRVCVQLSDEQRAWCGSRRAEPGELEPAQAQTLFATAERVAAALTRADYFGPFGIDAYLWRNARGTLQLNPLGELNARYTMGFRVGFLQP